MYTFINYMQQNYMLKNERLKIILRELEKSTQMKTADIILLFQKISIERTTIYRDLKTLKEK